MKKFVAGLTLVVAITSASVVFAAQSIFSDVEEGSWYAESVNKLVSAGIIEGYEDSTFRPANSVSRAELAIMFDRYDQYITDKFSTVMSKYTFNNLSFEYPIDFTSETDPNGAIIVSQNDTRIEFFTGDRPFGFDPESGDGPVSSNFIEVNINEGNINNVNSFNEYTFENGDKFLFFGITPENSENQNYTVWAYYKNPEERTALLSILLSTELK